MLTQDQVLPGPSGERGSAIFLSVRRIRNLWLAFMAIAAVLTLLFVFSSLKGLQAAPDTTGPQAGLQSQDHTQFLSTKDYLSSTEMLYKWVLADVALVLGSIEISLAISLYLRNLRAGNITPMPGRRLVPNILRSADRRYIHEQMSQEVAMAYLILSALALGSMIIAGFLVLDSATWILAAKLSRNW